MAPSEQAQPPRYLPLPSLSQVQHSLCMSRHTLQVTFTAPLTAGPALALPAPRVHHGAAEHAGAAGLWSDCQRQGPGAGAHSFAAQLAHRSLSAFPGCTGMLLGTLRGTGHQRQGPGAGPCLPPCIPAVAWQGGRVGLLASPAAPKPPEPRCRMLSPAAPQPTTASAGRGCGPGGRPAGAPAGRGAAGCMCGPWWQDAVLCSAHAGKAAGLGGGVPTAVVPLGLRGLFQLPCLGWAGCGSCSGCMRLLGFHTRAAHLLFASWAMIWLAHPQRKLPGS